ncbi:type II toxin-antitoxin system HigB family toxin [Chitinophaga pollutisoli]|uniref:Type II toxin-antitoxin system HigB family toxin n=1 Tax=Chitinophaga pollutisoli TaxID=3133966 RepID=A0ABZ2YJA0_9BACT
MVVISRKALTDFTKRHPASSDAFLNWFRKASESDWSHFQDVKRTFDSVDYVGNDSYVFNIKGNQFRLIARIIFPVRTAFIRWVGTHAAYNKLDMNLL